MSLFELLYFYEIFVYCELRLPILEVFKQYDQMNIGNFCKI